MSVDSISSYNPAITSVQQSLTSGSRINTSADDAAGQSVVTGLSTQINQQDVATRNANDGISLLQVADGVGANITSQLQRLNELATQAQNGTYNSQQRNALNLEFQQGLKAINQFAQQANFNGTKLLDGSTNNVDIALGDSTSSLKLPNLTSSGQSLDGLDLTSTTNASDAFKAVSTALGNLSTSRSQIGAQQNGLANAVDNFGTQNVNAQSARSQINDTNYAKAISEMVRQQVLQQSGVAMQAQSNQNKSYINQLLQS